MEILKLILMCIFLLFPLSTLASAAKTMTLPPVDESKEDDSFLKFKADLHRAIAKKDIAYIKKIVTSDVKYTFGPEEDAPTPADGFVKFYKLKKEPNAEFWRELKTVLELGCTASSAGFSCPYVNSKWPDGIESYQHIVTTAAKVAIRKKPSSSAPLVRHVHYEILKLASGSETKDWVAIALDGKNVGYVLRSESRSPIDYRAEFIKLESEWKLRSFIAGD